MQSNAKQSNAKQCRAKQCKSNAKAMQKQRKGTAGRGGAKEPESRITGPRNPHLKLPGQGTRVPSTTARQASTSIAEESKDPKGKA